MSRKHRLNPMKLLTLLLYGDYPYLEYLGSQPSGAARISIKPVSFAKLLRVRTSHIHEYLEWLESQSYIDLISAEKQAVTLVVNRPRLFREDH